jgi:hypothetical protein
MSILFAATFAAHFAAFAGVSNRLKSFNFAASPSQPSQGGITH